MTNVEFKCETVFNPAKASVLIMLVGILDEHAELPPLNEFKGIQKVEIDFRGLQFMNSVGITKFIRFNSGIEKAVDPEFTFTKCPRFIIDMINSIEGFLPAKGKVSSFEIPLFCERCERIFTVSQDTETFDQNNMVVSKLVSQVDCKNLPDCARDIKIDIMPKLFLRFLRK